MSMTRRQSLFFAAATVAVMSAGPVNAAPASSLIDAYWQQSGGGAAPANDAWAAFLSRYVRPGGSGVNLVAYGSVSAADRAGLSSYIATLEAARPTAMNRDAAMAYWINLYNAKTVDLVLEAFPVNSIKKVRGGFFNTGPWDDKVVTVEGRALSLNDIEHGILRPIWNDPRIHYAVNCASIGCPNLALRPYSAGELNGMLDAAARDYINHPRGAQVSGGRLTVSSIFDWYKVDFGGTDAGVIAHLRQYAGAPLAASLGGVSSIAGDVYDWNLNAG